MACKQRFFDCFSSLESLSFCSSEDFSAVFTYRSSGLSRLITGLRGNIFSLPYDLGSGFVIYGLSYVEVCFFDSQRFQGFYCEGVLNSAKRPFCIFWDVIYIRKFLHCITVTDVCTLFQPSCMRLIQLVTILLCSWLRFTGFVFLRNFASMLENLVCSLLFLVLLCCVSLPSSGVCLSSTSVEWVAVRFPSSSVEQSESLALAVTIPERSGRVGQWTHLLLAFLDWEMFRYYCCLSFLLLEIIFWFNLVAHTGI